MTITIILYKENSADGKVIRHCAIHLVLSFSVSYSTFDPIVCARTALNVYFS
jgi:hypothetical protein